MKYRKFYFQFECMPSKYRSFLGFFWKVYTLDKDYPSGEDELLLGQNDILLTPCQADHFRARGFNITDDVVLNGDGEGSDPCEEDDHERAYAVTD